MKHNINSMMALDVYLTSLDDDDYRMISDTLDVRYSDCMPILSWDFYSVYFNGQLKKAKRQQDILKIAYLAKTFHWQNDIQSIFNGNLFEALLLTNDQQQIVWVNDGFTDMTGYLKKDVINKTPRILQGQQTSSTSKARIREKLIANTPFTEVITNYKKDGQAYTCEVKIFPLKTNKTTHYLALERQVM